MKTPDANISESKPDNQRTKSIGKMEAISCGVEARLEEHTGYSRRVTDETINIARSLGVPDAEIERWAARRLTRMARDTERVREIKSLLSRVYGCVNIKAAGIPRPE